MNGAEFEAKMERFFDRAERAQERAGQATRTFVDRHRWTGPVMLLGFVAMCGGLFWYLATHKPPEGEDMGWHLPDWSLATWSTVGVAVIAAAVVGLTLRARGRGDDDA